MNRCITCGRPTDKASAEAVICRDDHEYLLCCPLCVKKFERSPEQYIAVYNTLFESHFNLERHHDSREEDAARSVPNLTHMIYNLQRTFTDIQSDYHDLLRHFERLSDSGGLEGLRNGLSQHHRLMSALEDKVALYSGMCRFLLSLCEDNHSAASNTA